MDNFNPVKEMRYELNMTSMVFAEFVETHQSQISRWENFPGSLKMSTLLIIAEKAGFCVQITVHKKTHQPHNS